MASAILLERMAPRPAGHKGLGRRDRFSKPVIVILLLLLLIIIIIRRIMITIIIIMIIIIIIITIILIMLDMLSRARPPDTLT